VAVADGRFPVQSPVRHVEFGDGVVTDLEEDRLTVLFEDVGYKTLSLRLVEEQGLLEPTALHAGERQAVSVRE
jgi:ATP-dependent DNA helicase RecQ